MDLFIITAVLAACTLTLGFILMAVLHFHKAVTTALRNEVEFHRISWNKVNDENVRLVKILRDHDIEPYSKGTFTQ